MLLARSLSCRLKLTILRTLASRTESLSRQLPKLKTKLATWTTSLRLKETLTRVRSLFSRRTLRTGLMASVPEMRSIWMEAPFSFRKIRIRV